MVFLTETTRKILIKALQDSDNMTANVNYKIDSSFPIDNERYGEFLNTL